jgi:hypothetical protein
LLLGFASFDPIVYPGQKLVQDRFVGGVGEFIDFVATEGFEAFGEVRGVWAILRGAGGGEAEADRARVEYFLTGYFLGKTAPSRPRLGLADRCGR